MMAAARVFSAVLVAATSVLATACTRTIDDARVVAAADMGKAPADGSECTSVDAPLTTVPGNGDDEPVMKIPQPAGWERVTMMDSELIRYTMRNVDLEKDGFAPTAVVTLESQRGITEPREIYEAQHEVLESGVGATDVNFVEASLCGEPAEILDYITPPIGVLPPHPAKVLCGVLHTDDETFAVTVTVQSVDPDNPGYQRDSEMILTGFQFLPPSES